MYRSNSPTYMNTHMPEIASSLALLGRRMYPGKAVTERKYSGWAAATWNATIPPLDGPAMLNFRP